MGGHHRRRPVKRLRLTEMTPKRWKTADPALFCIKLRAMTIYFQQVEHIFRRPNVKKVGWLVYVAYINNIIANYLETCTVHYWPAAQPRSIMFYSFNQDS